MKQTPKFILFDNAPLNGTGMTRTFILARKGGLSTDYANVIFSHARTPTDFQPPI